MWLDSSPDECEGRRYAAGLGWIIGGPFAALTSGLSVSGDGFGLGAGAVEGMGVTGAGVECTLVVCWGTDAMPRSGLGPSGSGALYTSFRGVEAVGATARPADPLFFGFLVRSFVN